MEKRGIDFVLNNFLSCVYTGTIRIDLLSSDKAN